MGHKLKAPFPYFGGKSAVADLVWKYLGDCDNVIEPFCGSCAFLLARPHPPRIETVNDADCYLANFWRATQQDPEAVVEHCDWPVNEADLHARHRWLVLSPAAADFRERMRTDPDYFDARVAGWWCWGLCCWIGSGWCSVSRAESEQIPLLRGDDNGTSTGAGVNGKIKGQDNRKPRIDGGEGQYGHGVHAKGQLSQKVPGMIGGKDARGVNAQLPNLSGDSGAAGRGVHASGGPNIDQKRPNIGGLEMQYGKGVHNNHRPQLADAYSRGRGVNGNDEAGTCEQRRAWLLDWFGRLRDRLRTVRVCCGDWLRVCESESVTTRLGLTGLFFDPPYSTEAGRDMKLYAVDCGKVAHDVRAYCLERGPDRQMRIVLAGYVGEGHEELERNGWAVVPWKAAGGYGNRSKKGKANAAKERLWISPHCLKDERDLFTE